jgi:hypothetical protein
MPDAARAYAKGEWRNPPRGPISLKESWRLADIHSQMGSVKVPHGNPWRSNLQRTSKQIHLGKNILIISVSYDFLIISVSYDFLDLGRGIEAEVLGQLMRAFAPLDGIEDVGGKDGAFEAD